MKKINFLWIGIISLSTIFVALLIFFKAEPAFAQEVWEGWRGYVPSGMQERTLAQYVQSIINAALLLAAVVAVVYLIIGGYKYITASGNAEAVGEAKTTIFNAIIGLVIIFAAYVIIDFVYNLIAPETSWWERILGSIGGGGSGGDVGPK